jgi:hypothetical protein
VLLIRVGTSNGRRNLGTTVKVVDQSVAINIARFKDVREAAAIRQDADGIV